MGATSKRPAISSARECRLSGSTPFVDPEPSSGNEPGALGISAPVVGLITGLDHDRIQVATYAEGET